MYGEQPGMPNQPMAGRGYSPANEEFREDQGYDDIHGAVPNDERSAVGNTLIELPLARQVPPEQRRGDMGARQEIDSVPESSGETWRRGAAERIGLSAGAVASAQTAVFPQVNRRSLQPSRPYQGRSMVEIAPETEGTLRTMYAMVEEGYSRSEAAMHEEARSMADRLTELRASYTVQLVKTAHGPQGQQEQVAYEGWLMNGKSGNLLCLTPAGDLLHMWSERKPVEPNQPDAVTVRLWDLTSDNYEDKEAWTLSGHHYLADVDRPDKAFRDQKEASAERLEDVIEALQARRDTNESIRRAMAKQLERFEGVATEAQPAEL